MRDVRSNSAVTNTIRWHQIHRLRNIHFFTLPAPRSVSFGQLTSRLMPDGVQYRCAEMYMMHQKAVLFGDAEIAEEILLATKPAAMKALGRKVKNFDEEFWKQNRRQIVKKGSMAKFSQNPDIRAELMATRGSTLVEASPRDRIWGIGMGKDNPNAKNKNKWRGQNLLGYILTEVRDELHVENEEQS